MSRSSLEGPAVQFRRLNQVLACLALGLTLAGCSGSKSATGPAITTQPSNQTVTVGQTATFSVVATGTVPLTYQWQNGATAISGATSANYTTPATTSADNGSQFSVVVSNSAGKCHQQLGHAHRQRHHHLHHRRFDLPQRHWPHRTESDRDHPDQQQRHLG